MPNDPRTGGGRADPWHRREGRATFRVALPAQAEAETNMFFNLIACGVICVAMSTAERDGGRASRHCRAR